MDHLMNRILGLRNQGKSVSEMVPILRREGFTSARGGRPISESAIHQRFFNHKRKKASQASAKEAVAPIITAAPARPNPQMDSIIGDIHEGVRAVLRLKLPAEKKLRLIESLIG